MNKDKKKSGFRKFLKIYILVFVVITIIAAIYVYSTLKKYEANQVDNYIESVISNLRNYAKSGEVSKHIDKTNVQKGELEKADPSIEAGLNELFMSDAEMKFELNKNSTDELKPIYDIYANNNKILEVGLDGSNMETRLSLLTFSNWKVSYINVEAEKGLFKLEISVPSNYNVFVNNTKLTDKHVPSSDIDAGLLEISKYVDIPYLVQYEVDGFIEKPTYKITDMDGKEINLQDIKFENNVKEIATLEEAKAAIKEFPNIMDIAEEWSLFLSSDLSRKPLWIF